MVVFFIISNTLSCRNREIFQIIYILDNIPSSGKLPFCKKHCQFLELFKTSSFPLFSTASGSFSPTDTYCSGYSLKRTYFKHIPRFQRDFACLLPLLTAFDPATTPRDNDEIDFVAVNRK
jgi:hypothetical protein